MIELYSYVQQIWRSYSAELCGLRQGFEEYLGFAASGCELSHIYVWASRNPQNGINGRDSNQSRNLSEMLLLCLSFLIAIRCTYIRVVFGLSCPSASCVSINDPVSSDTILA